MWACEWAPCVLVRILFTSYTYKTLHSVSHQLFFSHRIIKPVIKFLQSKVIPICILLRVQPIPEGGDSASPQNFLQYFTLPTTNVTLNFLAALSNKPFPTLDVESRWFPSIIQQSYRYLKAIIIDPNSQPIFLSIKSGLSFRFSSQHRISRSLTTGMDLCWITFHRFTAVMKPNSHNQICHSWGSTNSGQDGQLMECVRRDFSMHIES